MRVDEDDSGRDFMLLIRSLCHAAERWEQFVYNGYKTAFPTYTQTHTQRYVCLAVLIGNT